METTMTRSYKKHSYSFVLGAAETSKTADIDPTLGIKGEVVKLVVTLPDWTNTVTAIMSMINSDSKEVFASDSHDQNDEYDITLVVDECIILGKTGEKWKVTLSGVPGDIGDGIGGTVILTAYVRG